MGQTKSKPDPVIDPTRRLNIDHSKILPDFFLYKRLAEAGVILTAEQRKKADHDGGVIYYQLGELNYDRESYIFAFTFFAKAALQNNSSAQTSLGCMYERGDIDLVDNEMSYYWYMQAHYNDQNKHAQCGLGYIFDQRRGVVANTRTSIEWYEKSSRQNNPLAQFSLARMYEYMDGYTDFQKAINWYKASYYSGFEMGKDEMERLMKQGYKPRYKAKEFSPVRITDRKATRARDIVVVTDTTMNNQKFSFDYSDHKHKTNKSKEKPKVFQVNTSPHFDDVKLLKKRQVMMVETVQRMQAAINALKRK